MPFFCVRPSWTSILCSFWACTGFLIVGKCFINLKLFLIWNCFNLDRDFERLILFKKLNVQAFIYITMRSRCTSFHRIWMCFEGAVEAAISGLSCASFYSYLYPTTSNISSHDQATIRGSDDWCNCITALSPSTSNDTIRHQYRRINDNTLGQFQNLPWSMRHTS